MAITTVTDSLPLLQTNIKSLNLQFRQKTKNFYSERLVRNWTMVQQTLLWARKLKKHRQFQRCQIPRTVTKSGNFLTLKSLITKQGGYVLFFSLASRSTCKYSFSTDFRVLCQLFLFLQQKTNEYKRTSQKASLEIEVIK